MKQKVVEKENKTIYYIDFKDVQMKWYKSLPRYSDKELLSMFPEIVPDLPKILGEQEKELKKLELSVEKQLKSIPDDVDEMTRWLKEWGMQQCEISQILGLEKNIKFLKRLIDLASGKEVKKGYLTDDDFRNAKERPVLEVIEPHVEKLKRVGSIYMACCPFHDDNMPSLAIYPDSNTFKCFGCNLRGNVIEFVKLFYGLDFIQAVKWLKEN